MYYLRNLKEAFWRGKIRLLLIITKRYLQNNKELNNLEEEEQ